MATIKEIRHREWAEQIQECQNSGQTVKEWCISSGISLITYYNRLRAVREEMLYSMWNIINVNDVMQ